MKWVSLSFQSLGFSLKLVLGFVAILVPILGAWVGSSLAAYVNGPRWVAIVCALCAFPVLPLVWDLWARRNRDESKKQILTRMDRMILRTLAINTVFLGGLLLVGSSTLFSALTTRGDWMLDGQEGKLAQSTRAGLLKTADGMEWLFHAIEKKNEYEEFVEVDKDEDLPDDDELHDDRPGPSDFDFKIKITRKDPDKTITLPKPIPLPRERPSESEPEPKAVERAMGEVVWPFQEKLHPAVLSIPKSAETSLESTATYLVSQEKDPVLQVKALHDWVADRIAYDYPEADAIMSGGSNRRKQFADYVFKSRTAVCAGYANLMKAMGKAAGIDVRVVTGDTRETSSLAYIGHAWNSVKIKDKWYLMDVTWDSGHRGPGGKHKKRYSTDYFLSPAKVFLLNHLPRLKKWQMLETPITKGEFLRQPNVRPDFFQHGFDLINPTRSQISVTSNMVEVTLKNPKRHFVMASVSSQTKGDKCEVKGDTTLRISCKLPTKGIYRVMLMANESRNGTYWEVASVEVLRK